MFKKIREEINKHEREQLAKTENALHNMTAGAVLDSWYYRGLCTPKVFEAVKALDAGEKLGDDLIAKMMKKRAREEAKSTKIRIDKLNNVSQLVLIQTYLSAKDTEEALNKADYQFVSEMEIINTQALGAPSSIEPKLCIDSLNDIIVYFGTQRTPGQQPLGEDLHSEDTKRSIWPFTI